MAIPCKYEASEALQPRSWVMLEAKVSVQYHSLYKGVGPILTALSVVPAEAAEPDVAEF